MKRTAQITIFVLLGVVLVLGVASTIYLAGSEETERVAEEVVQAEANDEAVTPITSQVRSCIQRLTNERLETLASQGGHTQEELDSMQSGLDRKAYAQEAVDYYDDGELIVPYWYQSTDSPDCNGCSVTVTMPPLVGSESFASKTESYIEDNLPGCTRNFSAAADTYAVDTGAVDATVAFNREDTVTEVEWPLTITELASNTTYRVDTVKARMNIPMRQLYQAASQTVDKIAQSNVLPQFIRKVISYNSLNDEVPPMNGGTSIGRDMDVWLLDDVKETIRQGLSNYASMVTLTGPDEPLPSYDSYDIALFARELTMSSTDEIFDEHTVEASFQPNWPITLRLNGEKSPVITPQVRDLGVSFISFTLTERDFQYDVSYPLVFEVQNPEARNGEGLTMRFATEGNIRNSRPYTHRIVGDAGAEQSQDSVSFADLGGNDVTVNIDGPTSSSGSVELRCAGETILRGVNASNAASVQLPSCTNGQLSYRANLIQSETKNVSISPTATNEFTLQTAEQQRVNVSLTRKPIYNENDPAPSLNYETTPITGATSSFDTKSSVQENLGRTGDIENPSYVIAEATQDPLPNESITVLLNQVNGDYVDSVELSAGQKTASVNLYPGRYDARVMANYNLDEPITTEPEDICVPTDPVGITEECKTIPSQKIPGGKRQAVLTCVQQATEDQEYQRFINETMTSDNMSIETYAQQQGYNIGSCVDEQLSQQDSLEILTGYYTTENTSKIAIPRGESVTLNVPYLGYHPEQINITRDVSIMTAILDLPKHLSGVPAAQPKTTNTD